MNTYQEINASTILAQLHQNPLAPALGVLRQFEKFLENIKMKDGVCGSLKLASGDTYQGEYAYFPGNSSPFLHGLGEYKWLSGDSYKGLLFYNKKHGLGRFNYANGDSYYGPFSNNKKHGEGIYTMKCGLTFRTVFKNDVLVSREKIDNELDMLSTLATL